MIMMKINMVVVKSFPTFFLITAVLLGRIYAYTIDNYDKNSDDSFEVEVFGKCQEATRYPLDVMARTVNPIYLKPNPHVTNYIPPKPKNGGRPKIIPDRKTFMPRRVVFPFPRRTIMASPTNSYFYSSEGPLFRIWGTQWFSLK